MGKLLSIISRSTLLVFWEDWGEDVLDGISNVVGSILWGFCDIFFWILDLFEELYRKFAGIDTNVTTASGEPIDGDLVLFFIQSDIVRQIFMSIFVLSLFLLIIFTIFAIVKNQYAEKQEPVSKIVNNSFKALLMYLLVPIATIVCLLVGNVVLQAIDGATRTNDYAQTISDNLFTTATYNANRFRSGTQAEKAKQLWIMINDEMLPEHIIDEIEAECGIDLSDTTKDGIISAGSVETVNYDTMAIIIDEAFITGNLTSSHGFSKTSKNNFTEINNFYYALKISYITIWIGGAFLIWAIGKITWGLVARLFKMTLYYAISPAVMATYPIDGGKALGSWRGEMVKNGTMALCSVGILNVLYSVLPAFNNIDLYGDSVSGGGLASSIARLFIYIIAFSSAKDLVGAISGWFGAGDALGEGVKAKGAVTKPLKTAYQKGLGYFAGIRGGMKAAEDKRGNKFMGALQGAFSQTGVAKARADMIKTWDTGKKAGEDQYKEYRTRDILGRKDNAKLAEYEAYDEMEKIRKRYQVITGSENPEYAQTKKGADRDKLTKFLNENSDAGKAVYEDREIELNNERKRLEEQKGFVELLNTAAKAKKKELAKRADLNEQFHINTTGWDTSKMAEIKKALNDEIQAHSAKGENVDMLKDAADAYIQAIEATKEARDKVADKKETDTGFKEFVEGDDGKDVYNQALSGASKELEKVKGTLTQYEKLLDENEDNLKKLEEDKAQVVENYIFGNIGKDDPMRKKIDDYNKAHPKS